jgi:hypothetical protein
MDETRSAICDSNLIDDKIFAIDVTKWGLEDVLKECRAESLKSGHQPASGEPMVHSCVL